MLQPGQDPGSGEKYAGKTKRIINKDGSFNVVKVGADYSARDVYLFLINASWLKFLSLLILFYFLINLLFAGLYYVTGIHHLANLPGGTRFETLLSVFFFSVQTFTTVGYGNISPQGIPANIIASFEAMSGWLFFAIATGLMYGRFSRPSARILFSHNMVVTPATPFPKLLFRIANLRNNVLMEMEARTTLMLVENTNGQHNRQYYDLKLDLAKITFFPMNWTLVHTINEESPLYGKTAADLARHEAEVLILIKGFDETFSQVLHTRYSYRHEEIEWGARFRRTYETDAEGNIIMHLEQLGHFDPEPLPEPVNKYEPPVYNS